jgi:hypothetical protein
MKLNFSEVKAAKQNNSLGQNHALKATDDFV